MPERLPAPGFTRLLPWAIVLALGGLLVLAWLVPPRPPGGDGPVYFGMVRDLGAGTGVQAHRVLGPWIVAESGLDPDLAFRLMTYGSLLLTALAVFGASVASGLSSRASLLSIPCVLTTWATIGNLWDYHLVDALTWAFVAGAWWALAAGRLWLVAALAAIGTLAKEVALLVAVAAALSIVRLDRPVRSAAVAGGLLLPSGLTLLAIMRWAGLGQGEAAHYWQTWLRTVQDLGPRYLAEMTFNAYAIHWLLAALGLLAIPTAVRNRCLALLLAGAPLLLVGTPERMAEFLIPSIAVLSANALARFPLALSAAVLVGNGLFIVHKVSGLLTNEVAQIALIGMFGLVAVGELGPRLYGAIPSRASSCLGAAQKSAGGAALLLFGALYLSLGAPHGGFRAIELDAARVPLPRIDVQVVTVGPGLANGQEGVVGLLENRGRAMAWSPALKPDGRVLLSGIAPGGTAPFVAKRSEDLWVTASTQAPSGSTKSFALQPIRVQIAKEGQEALVTGRIENRSKATLSGVRVVVAAFDESGTVTAVIEATTEIDGDRLRPATSEPFRAAFPSFVRVATVSVFAEATVAE